MLTAQLSAGVVPVAELHRELSGPPGMCLHIGLSLKFVLAVELML